MGLRRNSETVDPPAYDKEDESGLFTLKLHHGGALLRSPSTRYVGGVTDYYDYVNGKSLSIEDLRSFISECRPIITSFKSGCRKIVGVDGCHLKTKRGGQLLVAVDIDPNNNIFPIAYAFVEVEYKTSWEWFMSHLYEDIKTGGDINEQYEWTFMSDKQKGLIEAFKTVLPRVDHRFCVRHLHENFKRDRFRATNYKAALWSAASATTTQYFIEAMSKMKKLDVKAYDWFNDKDPSQWSRAYFSAYPKCDVLLNNMCEVFNSFILDARDKPILTLMSMVKDLILVRMQCNRDKAEKWVGKLCPKPRARLLNCVKEASTCMSMKCDRTHFQVFSGNTSNQCVVDLEKRECTCRKWQLTGILCKHACASIRFNGDNVEDYIYECYTIATYKDVYVHAIHPMSGPELWPQTGRQWPLAPPMATKKPGRTKRLRRVNPIEVEDNGRTMQCKVRKYLCTICKEPGHNHRACKKNQVLEVDPRQQQNVNTQGSNVATNSSQITMQSSVVFPQGLSGLLQSFMKDHQP